MSGKTTLTANGTHRLCSTEDDAEVILIVDAAADLGGGTATVYAKPSCITGDGEALTDGALTVGGENRFVVGKDMIINIVVAGATGPSIPISFSTL